MSQASNSLSSPEGRSSATPSPPAQLTSDHEGELSLANVLARGPVALRGDAGRQDRRQALVKIEYQGPRCDDGTRNWVDYYPDDCKEEAEGEDHALILRYKKNTSELREKPLFLYSISVRSKELKGLIQEVFSGYLGFADKLAHGKFTHDFHEFAHRWDTLSAKLAALHDTPLVEQLELFCEALREEIGKDVDEFRELVRQGQITYGLLRMLFAPGEIFVDRSGRLESLLLVKSTDYVCGDDPKFIIYSQYVDYDGNRYGLEDRKLKVPAFKGSQSTERLEFIPLSFFQDSESLIEKLVARGLRAMELNQAGYMMHTGFAHFVLPNCRMEMYVEGRIRIDPDGFSKHCASIDLWYLPEEMSEPNPKRLMLMHSKIRGYDFANKRWGEFEVGNITDIVWRDAAFDRLVLSSSRKRLIKALVEGNEPHKGALDDIIQGKGQGLIMLLSGVPGTGKTLTAEAIAEHLRMPLYSATAGELDVSSTAVLEAALEVKLRLAARWGAVLLLDEADAFLEARKDGDTERNQRVAVFLRLLEYYKGVLILTTNRHGTFDRAFHSRIHLTMHYDPLDHHARTQIWKTFLSSSSSLLPSDFEQLGHLELNGRRIKHMVKMAQLLAQSEGEVLAIGHINDVLDIAMCGEQSFATE